MKVESKVSKRIESREFVKEFEDLQISAKNVELYNNIIHKLGSGIIKTKTNNKADKIVGDFLIGGNLSGNVEDRVLVLNIKYNKFADVVQPLLEFFSQIESNEFDDVSEFTYEVEARLEAEEPERSSGEEPEEPEEQEGENDNNLPVIS